MGARDCGDGHAHLHDADGHDHRRGEAGHAAALIAAKSHAVGFARSQRRATKHASDLLDVYRLVDRYHPLGDLVPELESAPGQIGAVIAAIVRDEYLANPGKAAASMASSQGTAIAADDVAQTMTAFVEDLDAETGRGH